MVVGERPREPLFGKCNESTGSVFNTTVPLGTWSASFYRPQSD